MLFPVAGVQLPWPVVPILGFMVGVLGGFWGIGGGWIMTPGLYVLGVPMNFAVGTSLAYILGQSVLASLRHREFGHMDVKVGLGLVGGMVVGTELGARFMEVLKRSGEVDSVVGALYLVFLGAVGVLILRESWKAGREGKESTLEGFPRSLRKFSVPPLIPTSEGNISLWPLFGAGVFVGGSVGVLGVGGGFVMLPVLIYLLGLPTHTAVGTSIFAVALTSAFATFSHSLKGNVDLGMALLLFSGAVVGTQLGAFATLRARGAQIRFGFGAMVCAAFLSMTLKLAGFGEIAPWVLLGTAAFMSSAALSFLLRPEMRTQGR